MDGMWILAAALATTLATIAALSLSRFSRSDSWRATVTPLASIIGSGFLVSGPLLAREMGAAASLAMLGLLIASFAVGAVVRYNIRYAEPFLAANHFHHPLAWLARLAQAVLAIAYAISVAYYLKLLSEFALKDVVAAHALVGNLAVTVLLALIVVLGLIGGLRRVEHLAHATVSVKLGIIAGMLAALALYWISHSGAPVVLPPAVFTPKTAAVLLGLLITVQGFETSRYMGHGYPAEMRIRTMRNAQLVSAVIYIAFLLLLTPFLPQAARTSGVAGILDVMASVAPFLGVLVLVGAVASQLSAAVADSIGSAGLLHEVSTTRLDVKLALLLSTLMAVGVVWLTDPFQVIALASRAFAVFYVLQCAIAVAVSWRLPGRQPGERFAFIAVGVLCLAVVLFGAPAG